MWKELDQRYRISSEGDVFDNKLNVYPKKCISNCGYIRVSIHGKMTALHRLVAKMFISNPDNKPNVNHKDKNKINNHVNNLEWCTQSENILHSYSTGRISGKVKTTPEQLRSIIEDLKTMKARNVANKYNLKLSYIYAVKQGNNIKRVQYNSRISE
jgi:hypothetical protein